MGLCKSLDHHVDGTGTGLPIFDKDFPQIGGNLYGVFSGKICCMAKDSNERFENWLKLA